MADEKPKTKVAIPITKFYLPKQVKSDIAGALAGNGYSEIVSKVISSLEKTGKLPNITLENRPDYRETVPTLNDFVGQVKPFQEGMTEAINDFKTREANLTLPEVEDYMAHLEAVNT